MCKAAGRCVAIILIVVGFFLGVGGVLTILVPEFLDCKDIHLGDFFDDKYDLCRNYQDTFRIAGGIGTAIGGGMLLIGIIMLCLLKSQPRPIVHRAPAVTVQMQQPQQQHYQQNKYSGAGPSAPPSSPYPNQQYQNPLAYQNQGYQHPQHDYQSYPNPPPPYYNQEYSKNPQGLPRAQVGYGQGGAPPRYQY